MDSGKIKSESELAIKEMGGEVCDWLPVYDITTMRPCEDVVSRALIMNAMINIAFDAPVELIAGYIKDNHLTDHLSCAESEILAQSQETLSQQDKINLHWYLESLWALLWVMGKIDKLEVPYPIPDDMVEHCPKLHENEGPEKFTDVHSIRSYEEVYSMRDLYYRAMWCCREFQLRNTPHKHFNMSLIMERRRALTWCLDNTSDWDNIPQDT